MWYCAHAILYLRHLNGTQDLFRVWENMYLIQAETDEEAAERAEKRAREDEGGASSDLRLVDGTPAEWVFVGIRKLIACQNEEDRPDDGTELTYSEYELPSLESVIHLSRGETLEVEYLG